MPCNLAGRGLGIPAEIFPDIVSLWKKQTIYPDGHRISGLGIPTDIVSLDKVFREHIFPGIFMEMTLALGRSMANIILLLGSGIIDRL